MPYIDTVYYTNVYEGKQPFNWDDLPKLLIRASEMIDVITGFKLVTGKVNIDNSIPFVQDQVKKATAKIVEYYVINGGYEATKSSEPQSVSIGSFKYSTSKTSSYEGNEAIREAVIQLSHTGLLYAGMEAIDNDLH